MNDNQKRQFNIPLDGRLFTSVDPAQIGKNFRKLQNMRYVGQGTNPRGIPGMEKIGQVEYEVIESSLSASIAPIENIYFLGWHGIGDVDADGSLSLRVDLVTNVDGDITNLFEDVVVGSFYRGNKLDVNNEYILLCADATYYNGAFEDDLYFWIVQLRDIEGSLLWDINRMDGTYVHDVILDTDAAYACGGSGGTNYATRIEKYSLSDGSIIWSKSIKINPTSTYGRAISIAIDADYVYVSCYEYWVSGDSKQQGYVLRLSKADGDYSIVHSGTIISGSAYKHMEISVATKSRTGSGLGNVYALSLDYITQLDGAWTTTFDVMRYGGVHIDQGTRSEGIAVDDTGIYMVCQLFEGTFPDTTNYGYEVIKLNFSGEVQWTTVHDDEASKTGGYFYGPYLSDIDVDANGVYISGFHYQEAEPTEYYRLRQKLDKITGAKLWTLLSDNSGLYWGVSTVHD